MKPVIVQYRVNPDQVEVNASLIRAVYQELNASAPDGFRYVTLRHGEDGRSFLHLAAVDDGAKNPLPSVAAFQEFQRGVRDRCEVPPVASDAVVVGGYRLLVD